MAVELTATDEKVLAKLAQLEERFAELESQFVEFLSQRGSEPKSEFFIPTVVDTLIKQDKCQTAVLHSDEKWFGMTYHEDREKVIDSISALIDSGVYPPQLWG